MIECKLLPGTPSGHAPDVAAQVEFDSRILKQFIIFGCEEISSRRFQVGFDRVNLHRPTQMGGAHSVEAGVVLQHRRQPPRFGGRCLPFSEGAAERGLGF